MVEHITNWEKFLVSEIFEVSKVDVTTEPVRVRTGPKVIGGKTRTTLAGHKDSMEIYLEPNDTPVEKLDFLGSHKIFKGDKIRTHIISAYRYMFYGESKNIYDDGKRTAYEARELEPIETAYKIEKLDENCETLITYTNPVIVKPKPR